MGGIMYYIICYTCAKVLFKLSFTPYSSTRFLISMKVEIDVNKITVILILNVVFLYFTIFLLCLKNI